MLSPSTPEKPLEAPSDSSPRWATFKMKGNVSASRKKLLNGGSNSGFVRAPDDDDNDKVRLIEIGAETPPGVQATPFERTVAGKKELSGFQAAFALCKCVLGAGSFILPAAIQSSGLLAGVASLLILGGINAITMSQLSHASHFVQDRYPSHRIPTLQDLATKLMGHKAWGIGVGAGMVCLLFGVLAVYVDLIAQLVRGVTHNALPTRTLQLLLVVPLSLLALLRDFRWLAWTSLVGNIAVGAGMVAVIVFGSAKHGMASPADVPQFNSSTYSKFFGQATFLFCIQANILPIAQAMSVPARFPRVAQFTMLVLAVFNGVFGGMGYLIFKDNTKGLVLDNLGTSTTVYIAVSVLLAVDLLFSAPILLSSPRRILERAFVPHNSKHKTVLENTIRITSVVVVVVISIAIPNVNDLATLVGAMFSPLMGFIIPPVFYLKMNPNAPLIVKAGNVALILFGVFAGIYTTQQQLRKMFS